MKTLKCCSTWNLEYNFRHQLYCFRQIHITAIKNILKLKNASCSILECVMFSLIFLARIAFGPPLGGGLNKKLTRCARLGFFLVRFRVQARTAPNKKSQHFRASFLFVGKTVYERHWLSMSYKAKNPFHTQIGYETYPTFTCSLSSVFFCLDFYIDMIYSYSDS